MMKKQRSLGLWAVLMCLTAVCLAGCNIFTGPDKDRVATPTFDPPGGAYEAGQTVTISCSTPGATIYYSTDGSAPTLPYVGPLDIDETCTLKAVATRLEWKDSAVASTTYNIGRVSTPTFDPPGGTYHAEQEVTISCATTGTTIRYTTDGSEPSESSPKYNNPIPVTGATATLKARAYKSGWVESNIGSTTYTLSPATPTFDPPGGLYVIGQTVTISCSTPGATIYYSTDGSAPTLPYLGPLDIDETCTLKAVATRLEWMDSAVAYAAYFIGGGPGLMIYVQGGTFTMGRTRGSGDSDELPTHTVTLNSYYIGTYEVTQAEYSQYMQPGSSWTSNYGLGINYPAYYVSWYAILKYCNLRSLAEGLTPVYSISGSTNPANWGAVPTSNNATWNAAICNWNANGYRLPTEAEWEYAARGGTNTPDYLYSGSDDINAVAWHSGNSGNTSHTVVTKAPNGLGTYDMSGNVLEWCWDWYSSSYYSSSPASNPHGPASGTYRLWRGGGWNGNAASCRVSYRNGSYPYSGYNDYGFRLCRAMN